MDLVDLVLHASVLMVQSCAILAAKRKRWLVKDIVLDVMAEFAKPNNMQGVKVRCTKMRLPTYVKLEEKQS